MNESQETLTKPEAGQPLAPTAGSASLGRDCCGQEIISLAKKMSAHRNRHPNCDGTGWGWIEGCTLNICWSNNKHFDEKRAYELVARYNSQSIRI